MGVIVIQGEHPTWWCLLDAKEDGTELRGIITCYTASNTYEWHNAKQTGGGFTFCSELRCKLVLSVTPRALLL